MLEVIKNYNQKSVILLKKLSSGWLASVIVFNESNESKILGQKVLNEAEYILLLTEKRELESRNIFIIFEENISTKPFLLASPKADSLPVESADIVPSPYFLSLFREAEFFSTQKTRGPNK
ncbi:MAG TPA: hypothetical protein VFA52_01480 [Candidatus Paceibacterota bacterium]|nr:hypothetical protein [Candidatus Paceibacterota bacterium]